MAWVVLLPSPAASQEDPGGGEVVGLLRAAPAYFDVGAPHQSLAVDLTYRADAPVLWRLRHQLGLMATLDGGMYVHGGLSLPFELAPRTTIGFALGAGYYERGSGSDLGSPLEFRSEIRIDLATGPRHGLSFFVYHLSNAGTAASNPGAEVVGVGYVLRW